MHLAMLRWTVDSGARQTTTTPPRRPPKHLPTSIRAVHHEPAVAPVARTPRPAQEPAHATARLHPRSRVASTTATRARQTPRVRGAKSPHGHRHGYALTARGRQRTPTPRPRASRRVAMLAHSPAQSRDARTMPPSSRWSQQQHLRQVGGACCARPSARLRCSSRRPTQPKATNPGRNWLRVQSTLQRRRAATAPPPYRR